MISGSVFSVSWFIILGAGPRVTAEDQKLKHRSDEGLDHAPEENDVLDREATIWCHCGCVGFDDDNQSPCWR